MKWPILYYFVLCVLGAWVLSYLKKRFGQVPQTAHEALTELKAKQSVDYSGVFRNLLAALVILIFGAGVGPEAALLGAIISLSVWQSDKLRYLYFHYDEQEQQTFWTKIQRLLHPQQFVQRYDTRLAPVDKKKLKQVMNGLFIVNGLVVFTFLMKLVGHPSFITKLGTGKIEMASLWLILPALLTAFVISNAYQWLQAALAKLCQPFEEKQSILVSFGAACIFLFVILMPRLLFSGQSFMHLVPSFGSQQAWYILVVAAIMKLVFLQVCLHTGWIGGDIFPVVFSAILIGFAVAQFFPTIDSLFVVAIFATSLTTQILGTILVPGIFVGLFFPITLWPVVVLVLFLQWLLKNKIIKSN
ncbi:chloride ion channel protein [Enterococcus faecalis]|nr:chloride ion channel protein [Enterococcus faecalis]EGO8522505.1 chloride ion channel protein [Enterococcus faecalis]EGO8846551.1 chloride ion channel protein [Enterococcus faecalis]EGO8850492.1 chloride ion channel protein [Enterococcus faecalis]EGO8880474.1 chloride ion channel protein [Enterococcus faecalis]